MKSFLMSYIKWCTLFTYLKLFVISSICLVSNVCGFCFVVVVVDVLGFFFGLFAFSRAASAAYGGSQARGPIGAVAAGLRHRHSSSRSEQRLRPTPQLTAMPAP